MNIFFSWQSDLNLKNNKNFIEECIKTAIKEFNAENKHLVEFNLDKDTTGEPGNPEIINIILNKIDNSKLFICDLSIMNQDYHGRKTPNPNVIFELGYAIKSLGWERIICIVNQEFGLSEDMPFDIKHRRNLVYNLITKDKKNEKRKIVDAIKSNINILKERGLLHNELDDYFKRDIDTEFITICNHLRKIIFEKNDRNLLIDVNNLLNLPKDELKAKINNKAILGFYLFKHFEVNAKTVKKIIDNIISVSNFKKEKIVTLVKFKDWLDWYNKFNGGRTYEDLYIKLEKVENYKIVTSNNKELPNRIILGKLLPENKMIVDDFGDIGIKPRIDNAVYYHKVNTKYLENYSHLLYNFIEIANEWLDKTGGEFILDTHNHFEIK
ncbi:TIR domain-containing protein [Myroides odoratimimus]|uniref:TIR domain-containing protein n=1 Tax=Myroides odoratimimus TaxID=76832 RepID=UPI00091711BC|nr:TIR domain-containing protein [Myroides odoratimimus]SHM37016.1 hypothetical protein SAMN05444275_11281 [Myroides odoratimimus subsp. xuanwuensis]